jgi:hypothetical protein
LTDDPRILPALLVSAGAGQRYQALSVLARALANPSIAADPKDRLGEQLRDVITMGVEGAALAMTAHLVGGKDGPHTMGGAGFTPAPAAGNQGTLAALIVWHNWHNRR